LINRTGSVNITTGSVNRTTGSLNKNTSVKNSTDNEQSQWICGEKKKLDGKIKECMEVKYENMQSPKKKKIAEPVNN
jgi:hypothetical protein